MCAALMEAVQKWRAEKESRLSGEEKQQQEEEDDDESIYAVHNEQVNCPLMLHTQPITEKPGSVSLCSDESSSVYYSVLMIEFVWCCV